MNRPIIKIPVKYGAVASLLLLALFIILFYSGKHPLGIPIVLDIRIVILPLFMFLATKEFKDRHNEGTLHFWQGLTINTIIGLTIALLMAVSIMLFIAVDPDFFNQFLTHAMEFAESRKELVHDESELLIIQEQIDNLPFTRPYYLAIDYFLKTLPFTLVWSLIISILLRKQPNL